jgi:hypothetical protein
MEWSISMGPTITLAAGLLIISVMFWGGQAFMNFLGDEAPAQTFALAVDFVDERPQDSTLGAHLPDDQKRVATQLERDDAIRKSETPRRAAVGRSGLS